MATTTKSRSAPRPLRTLIIFLMVIVAMFALLFGIDVRGKSDDSVWKPRLGLDLQGGTRIALEASASSGQITAEKLSQARDIIEQRVNGTGVTEAEVTTQSGNQIVIEVPGKQEQSIADQVGRTAQLRFRLLWGQGQQSEGQSDVDVERQKKIAARAQWDDLSLDQMIKAETEGIQTLPENYQTAFAGLQQQANAFQCSKEGLGQVEDVPSEPLVTCDPTTGETMVLSPTVIPGSEIKTADAVIPQQTNEWAVSLELKGDGTDAFDKVTEALSPAQNRFAIVLDGEVLSAPASQAHIVDGRSQITGSFTSTSAKELANSLKYGALPLTFSLNSSSFEGPSLAGTQLQGGLIAGAIGIVLVVIYSLLYYRGLGFVIVSSLLVASVMTYAVILLLGKGVGFALTLPGIAGLIVGVGITADSFIIYFERIRDEARGGKSLRLAVEAGWKRARATILAADAVSFLAAAVLYIFAIGVVRGFAFALGLTTIIDVLVVLFFSKPLMTLLVRTKFFGQGHKLSGLDTDHLGVKGRKVTELSRTPGGNAA